MNDSEMSMMNSTSDVIPPSGTASLPLDWVDSSDHSISDIVTIHDKANGMGRRNRAPSAANTIDELPKAEREHVEQQSKNMSLDFGFWLFHDPVRRLTQWESLRASAFDSVEPGMRAEHTYGLFKQGCDVVGSFLLLIALLPLFVVTAILIKLDSPGPVFFRHERVGQHGRNFLLWKFRSMRMDVGRYEISPQSADDVRLTRVGRLLRRWSIDELPQLVNVLKRDMSLVGPRPEMPFLVAQYGPIEMQRLAAKPGITGLWQISPARAFPIHENLKYDFHYIRNQNVFLDCAILLRTITAVIYGIGAV
ncbi:MAG TPA: sugar transferase [Edaphobacter sp.]|jgi:lipopolysaccharide/colanic/teichoic acid biosynthesis glycosyltransferase|nr:sugar transferase [Edaphobacter sp.]